ncbi:MAG TPA: TonB-dependent receptor, partial [Blastocatellia bacterium]|nr:TonB-dependent receptor [Blastocatellia bacterium]
SYQVTYQNVYTSRFFTNGPGQSAPAIQFGISDFVSDSNDIGRLNTFNVTNNLRLGKYNLITGGLEYEHESFTQDFTSPFFSNPRTTDTQSSLAFFAQDQITAMDGKLYFMAAFRSQAFFLSNPQSVPQVQNIDIKRAYTGDGSVSYRVLPNTKLRSHVGNSFRAPSLSERFVFFQGTRIGDPFLQPERGISFDGGIDQTFANNKVRASATYFYTRLQQIITSTALFHETNGKGALSRGLELSLEAAPYRGFTLNSSYTFTNSHQVLGFPILTSDNTTIPGGVSFPSLSVPKHSFSFEANQAFAHGFNVNFNLYAVGQHDFTLFDPIFFSEVLFNFKGYTKAALGGSYTRNLSESKQMTFYGKIDNLFNQKIQDEGFLAPKATALAGIKFRF